MYRKEGERTWPDFPVDLSLSLSLSPGRERSNSFLNDQNFKLTFFLLLLKWSTTAAADSHQQQLLKCNTSPLCALLPSSLVFLLLPLQRKHWTTFSKGAAASAWCPFFFSFSSCNIAITFLLFAFLSLWHKLSLSLSFALFSFLLLQKEIDRLWRLFPASMCSDFGRKKIELENRATKIKKAPNRPKPNECQTDSQPRWFVFPDLFY